MATSGLAELAFTLGLIVVTWLGGAILIKADDVRELRHAAARRKASLARNRALSNLASRGSACAPDT
jgi:hypothetical protein